MIKFVISRQKEKFEDKVDPDVVSNNTNSHNQHSDEEEMSETNNIESLT